MTTLTQLFTNIAGAIRSKTGGTAPIPAENFPTEIAAIATGTDTSDATATAADIEDGKTAYVKGQKVTGNLMVLGDTYQEYATPKVAEGKVSLGGKLYQKMIIQSNSNIEFLAPYSSFGTATAADVAAGKTFTGADGLKVEGIGNLFSMNNMYISTKVVPSMSYVLGFSDLPFQAANFMIVGNQDRIAGGYVALILCLNGNITLVIDSAGSIISDSNYEITATDSSIKVDDKNMKLRFYSNYRYTILIW